MDNTRVYRMIFADVYPLYIQKAEKKGRIRKEYQDDPEADLLKVKFTTTRFIYRGEKANNSTN